MRSLALQANPLRSVHPQDRPPYPDLLARATGCSLQTAEIVARAYPRGAGLRNATAAQLRSLGLTSAQASRLVGTFELVDHVALEASPTRPEILEPDAAIAYLSLFNTLEQESFFVILLDAKQHVIDVVETARGDLDGVTTHAREIFREAVRLAAHSVIVAHNHPTGVPEPSAEDVGLTQWVVNVGELIGVPVVDSIIVGRDARGRPCYLSLLADGAMPTPFAA